MKDFNWNDLKFFVAMARSSNPTAAARQLHVDHNTVRRRVSALETDLNARLFDRRGDQYSLTDEGEALLRLSEQIESLITATHSEVTGSDLTISGTVRLGVPDGLGTLFIAPRLNKLLSKHPHLNLELVVTSRNFNLSKREADIAIMIDRPTDGRVNIKKLSDVTMRLHASQSYLEKSPAILSLEDLPHHAYVAGMDSFDFGPGLNKVLQVTSPSFVPKITCTNSVAQLKAAAAGCGLCFFANFMVANEPNLMRILPDEVSLTREIWLAVHADLKDLARIRAVISFLSQEFIDARLMFE